MVVSHGGRNKNGADVWTGVQDIPSAACTPRGVGSLEGLVQSAIEAAVNVAFPLGATTTVCTQFLCC